MPGLTVRVFGPGGTTTLNEDDFSIETRTTSGCCAGFIHVIVLDD